MTRTASLAVGGENLIDYVTRDGASVGHPGGSPFNVAMALGRQGVDVSYVSPISTDEWGDLLAERLVESGVRLSGGRRPEPTTMARVTVADGIPTYRFERSGTAERMVTEAGLRAAIPDSAIALHTGSLTLTDGPDAAVWEAVCAACHAGGRVVSLDPNVRLSVIADVDAYRARIQRMCRAVHVLKLSDEDLEGLYPDTSAEDAIAALRSGSSARVIVLTRGGDGCAAWLGEDHIELPAAPVSRIVDTVGAGDTFTATLLAGLLDGGFLSPDGLATLRPDALAGLLLRAGAAAAINCTRAGCNPPNRAEIEAALHRKA